MRKIIMPLNSSRSDWAQQLKILRGQLEAAINLYTALEQPPRSPDAYTAKATARADRRMAREIKDAVADIATALGVSTEVKIKVEFKGGRWAAHGEEMAPYPLKGLWEDYQKRMRAEGFMKGDIDGKKSTFYLAVRCLAEELRWYTKDNQKLDGILTDYLKEAAEYVLADEVAFCLPPSQDGPITLN